MADTDLKASSYCGARTKSKQGTCRRPAGWGTNHPGVGRCKLHGGASPNAEVAGVVELARQEAVVMGEPRDYVDPGEALLNCIRLAEAEVRYADEQVRKLNPDQAVGPVVTTRPLKMEGGAESYTERAEEHGPPALHIWIKVRQEAMDRLVNYSKVAIAAGLEKRRVELAEAEAHAIAQVVRGSLEELGIADRDDILPVVRKHLELVAGLSDAARS